MAKHTQFRHLTAILVISAAAITQAAAAPCFGQREQLAAGVHMLKAELMVAALKCSKPAENKRSGGAHRGYTGIYNGFVESFGDRLAAETSVLERHFHRSLGPSFSVEFNTFLTRLANRASGRSMRIRHYCRRLAPLFEIVPLLEDDDIDILAEDYKPMVFSSGNSGGDRGNNIRTCKIKDEAARTGEPPPG